MNDSSAIGKFIRELRLEKKLSQYQLANMIPISRQAVSKWERGINIPDSGTLLILSELFGITVNELLLGKRLDSSSNDEAELQTLAINMLTQNVKKIRSIKKLKISFIILIVIFVNIFLIYYFFNSYNSIKVYTLEGSGNFFSTRDGIFVVTKDKIYFRLGNLDYNEDIQIESVELYYKNGDEKIKIYSKENENILIRDYYGYEEYFDLDNLNFIMDNLYLEIIYDGGFEDIKINLTRDFSNNSLLFFKYPKVSSEYSNDNKLVLPVMNSFSKEKMDCDGEICVLEINGEQNIIFNYIVDNNLLNIYDNSSLEIKEWNYFIDEEMIIYRVYREDEDLLTVEMHLRDINDLNENYKYLQEFQNNYILKYLY